MKDVVYGINLGFAALALLGAFLTGLSLSAGLAVLALILLLAAQRTEMREREQRHHREIMAALKAIYQKRD